jgi:hypothetical protein
MPPAPPGTEAWIWAESRARSESSAPRRFTGLEQLRLVEHAARRAEPVEPRALGKAVTAGQRRLRRRHQPRPARDDRAGLQRGAIQFKVEIDPHPLRQAERGTGLDDEPHHVARRQRLARLDPPGQHAEPGRGKRVGGYALGTPGHGRAPCREHQQADEQAARGQFHRAKRPAPGEQCQRSGEAERDQRYRPLAARQREPGGNPRAERDDDPYR